MPADVLHGELSGLILGDYLSGRTIFIYVISDCLREIQRNAAGLPRGTNFFNSVMPVCDIPIYLGLAPAVTLRRMALQQPVPERAAWRGRLRPLGRI